MTNPELARLYTERVNEEMSLYEDFLLANQIQDLDEEDWTDEQQESWHTITAADTAKWDKLLAPYRGAKTT